MKGTAYEILYKLWNRIKKAGLITAVDYDSSQQMYTVEFKYELDDSIQTHEYFLSEDGSLTYSHIPDKVYRLETKY